MAKAPLLGLDTLPLVECVAGEERTGQFWRQLKLVDRGIIGAPVLSETDHARTEMGSAVVDES